MRCHTVDTPCGATDLGRSEEGDDHPALRPLAQRTLVPLGGRRPPALFFLPPPRLVLLLPLLYFLPVFLFLPQPPLLFLLLPPPLLFLSFLLLPPVVLLQPLPLQRVATEVASQEGMIHSSRQRLSIRLKQQTQDSHKWTQHLLWSL